MGYETNILFVRKPLNKNRGFMDVIASVEMGKINYNNTARLILKTAENTILVKDKLSKKDEQTKAWLKEYQSLSARFLNNLSEAEQIEESDYKRLYKLQSMLDKRLPYVYSSNNYIEEFTDHYGDCLMILSLEELSKAISADLAKNIVEGEYGYKGYRRYHLALALIKEFQDEDQWDDSVQCVLFGH